MLVMKYANYLPYSKSFFMLNMKSSRHPQGTAPAASGLFVWLSRLFWAVWVAYPLFVWQSVRDILQAKTNTLAVAPDLAGWRGRPPAKRGGPCP